MNHSDDQQPPTSPDRYRRVLACIEVALIFLLLFVFTTRPPPGDDEPHYLGKAKQYWDPDWLAGDFFLETPDAHVVFNWVIGRLTLYFSLDAVAWIARCAAWLSLAVAWRRLSRAILPRPLVSLWTIALFLVFQEHGTAAQEWIVRGVEAKCFAYVFVLLGLEQIVRGRWSWVWPLLGAGAAFHVLVGGWAVVAAFLAWIATNERTPLVKMLPSLIVGGLLSLPGLVPGLLLSWKADPEVVAQANQIYVFDRLSHHLVVYDFAWRNKLQFTLVLAAWLLVCFLMRSTPAEGEPTGLPLRRFVLGTIVIGIVGLIIDQTTAILESSDLAASLLRFYWYRLADVMVPLGLAFALAEWTLGERKWPPKKYTDAMLFVFILMPLLVIAWHALERRSDGRPMADVQSHIGEHDMAEYHAWRSTCQWVRENTSDDARFLIPPSISSFRWYAQRSEVVSRKDIPQNAEGIVEWSERVATVNRWYRSVAKDGLTPKVHDELLELAAAEKYDFQYVIIHGRELSRPSPLEEVYASDFGPSPDFVVYRVPLELRGPEPTGD